MRTEFVTLERFDTAMRAIDERFDTAMRAIDERFDAIDHRFESLEGRLTARIENAASRTANIVIEHILDVLRGDAEKHDADLAAVRRDLDDHKADLRTHRRPRR